MNAAGCPDPRSQAIVGLSLASLIIAAWLAVHVHAVFLLALSPTGLAVAPLHIALICWLNVGLFIIAHDAMHGSLAPFRPGTNRFMGRLCLALYAGLSFDRIIGKHFAHHRHSGTADDPDFNDHPHRFWPWYGAFMLGYFSWREFAILTGILAAYVLALGAPIPNLLLFWAVPALLSSVQLFYFGTYLPHRRDSEPFADRHNARSSGYSWLASLLTCFHFGYHHEHHAHPHVPWWRLPSVRTAAGRVGGEAAPAL